MIALSFVAGFALAGAPELVVVGLHNPGLTGSAADAAAEKITAALDATGKVDALAPGEVSKRIAGREALILDAFALGPARDLLREGRILYDRAQPDQAIPVLEQASGQLAAGLATSTDARDLHEALTLLGLAHAGLGDEAAARAAFRRAVALDPARQLDTVKFPPPIVAMYESVRSEVAAQPRAKVSLTAPAGTPVWVDGRSLGSAPLGEVELPAGEHYLLARSENGASYFETLTLTAGERRSVTATLSPRAVGRASADVPGRSRQARDLYKSIGAYTDRDPVLLAGLTGNGQVALQLYSPASGSFSKALTADAGSDPVSAIVDLAPAMVGFLTETGDIKSDRVSPQVLPLDIASNDVLAGMLLDPPEAKAPTATVEKKGVPWYLWAGLGAVAVGGGVTGAVLAANGGGGGDNGTITLGPIP